MINELKIFKNNEFGEIRVRQENSNIYFCLSDVCRTLEIGNVSQLKNRLNQGGVISSEVIDNLGRVQTATFINESNLYKVIFQSRKPEAERFTDWVTVEVLPSIRKNGGYIAGQDVLSDDELLSKALMVAQNKISEKNKLLQEQQPKVLFAESVMASNRSILIRELAKHLKQNGLDIGEKRLFAILRRTGYLISKFGSDYNTPTQKSMDLRLFQIKKTIITHSNGFTTVSSTPLITGKGQVYFLNKFLKGELV